jgi:zinc protease
LDSRTGFVVGMLLSGVTFSCVGPRGSTAGGGPGAGTIVPAKAAGAARAVASVALGSLTIRKWQLDNGLGIITLPDAGARAVSYVTTFQVGSRDEDAAAGETGLAHLFEHLMFTETRGSGAAGDFDQRIEEVGGSSNAMTDYDSTSYVDEIPPDALGLVIRLESDRMVNLKLTSKQVANERDVVIEERLGSVEDSVDGLLDEMMHMQAFRRHPYRWPIIGRMRDIKSITQDRALAFYRRHYAPNRAVVVVAGCFDETVALAAISAAYGGLTPAPGDAPNAIARERAPAAEVRTSIERPVPADRFVIGYPAPALGDPDRAPYELLAEVLMGGPSSRLYRQLVVDRELASSIAGDVSPTRDPGLWAIWVQMTKGNDAPQAEELILREIERIASPSAPSVTAAELDAAKNRLETAFWEELGPSRARAEALGHFDVTTGDFRNLVARGSAWARVTADDVGRVARDYLRPGARSVVIAHPKGRP